ncbi:hypothetical protein T01_9053 [Trichinella spiralis]|uniref:Receptor expression-enhancing protein 5 n=1 Tax=Trichinella spiralis TaxID=6334 RepID=A0A0V1AVV1_TRISP|nr:hypothetical protein T01_9053 [Trichinella spiralis]
MVCSNLEYFKLMFHDLQKRNTTQNYSKMTVKKRIPGPYQKSGRSRYQAAIVLAGVICMLLAIYNPAVKLLCDLICIVYPVMKTLAEMESIEKSKCKQWMFYWSNLIRTQLCQLYHFAKVHEIYCLQYIVLK